jgi:hypothetical protein
MNLESKFLSKKRSSKLEEVIIFTYGSVIEKFIKKIKQINKKFKLENNQGVELIKKIFKVHKEKSTKSLHNFIKNELTGIELEKLDEKDIREFTRPPVDQQDLLKVKSKIYENDQSKRLLRKNVWNYIECQISELTDIKHIKPIDNHIIHNLKKDFEKNLMNTNIIGLYENHYNIKVKNMLEIIDHRNTKKDKNNNIARRYDNLSKPEKEKILNDLLSRSFKDYFFEYRKSDKFLKEAKEIFNNDGEKILNYIQMSNEFIKSFINIGKADLSKFEDEENIFDIFSNC